MRRDWKTYNKELVKRGEILIDPETTAVKPKGRKKRRGRPSVYPEQLIMLLLFLKFALRLPYRQTEGLAKKVFVGLGIKILLCLIMRESYIGITFALQGLHSYIE